MDELIPRERVVLAPGAVHLPDWLPPERQAALVEAARGWARGPAGLQRMQLPGGGVMSVRQVCLGWRWEPYRYTRTDVKAFPAWLGDLGREALAAAAEETLGDPAAYRPDAALLNFYDDAAKMGMHQDREERSPAPVVSLSIGDHCVFRWGNSESRGQPYTDVELRSGDVFVFGGPSRFAFHGVPKVLPGTADPACGMKRGRLNLTLRVTGLE